MTNPIKWIADLSGFVPRWECGAWSGGLGWTHIVSDLLIWLAYLAILVILVVFVYRRRDLPFPRLFWLFGIFIVTCGTTHLLEAVIFYSPVYRLSGVVKVLTAVASWATVVALIPIIPRALALRSPQELEREVAARTAALAAANDALRQEAAERDRAEGELRDQREWLRVVLASVGEAIVATDTGQRITFLNPAAEALIQWQAIEVIGRPLEEVIRTILEESRDWLESPVAQVIRSDRDFGLTNHALLVRRDGAERIIERSATPIRGPKGDIRGVVVAIRDATERRTADRARAYLAAIVNDSTDPIIGKDLNGSITSWNRAAEQLFGYTATDAIGQNIRLLIPADRLQEEVEILAKLRRGERVEHFDTVRVTRDGRMVEVALTVSPIRDAAGTVVGASKVLRDITDQKRAEAELRQSARHIQLLLDSTAEGIYGIDREGRCTFINRSGARMLGYTPGEVAAVHMHQLIHHTRGDGTEYRPGDCPIHQVNDLTQGGQSEDYFWRKDGECFPAATSVSPIRDEIVQGAVITFTDITARKEAESALYREREFLGAVLEHIAEGVIVCDVEGRLTLSNRAARAIHGVGDDPLPADKWFDQFPVFGPDGETRLVREEHPLMRALGGERVRNAEFVIHNAPAPRRTVAGSGQPLYDPTGRKLGAVLALHDLTERRTLEEQFRQSHKMEAIGRLAGGIAHDFNNLLTVIIGYAEMIRSNHEATDSTHGLVGEIYQAGQRAAQLTRQLLAFSRQSVLAPRLLDLNSVVENLERMLRRLIGADVTFVTRLQPKVGQVLADPTQIEQILMNLIVNARDAMPQGGRLIIETTDEALGPDDMPGVTDFRQGPYVRLAVADTGIGMTDEVRARIFEPFFTTKEKGQGTGLGLATVYGAVRQAGGHVVVDTSPGRGTTFRVYFPRAQGHVSGDRPAAGSGSGTVPATPRGGETVLLVEDEPSLRELSRTILQVGGYTVLLAENGTEAIRLAETHPGPIHLLLADVVMPGEGGPAVAARVAEQRPAAKVLFVSGYTSDEVIRHGLLLDTVNFLQKPFTPGALAKKVREVLDGK